LLSKLDISDNNIEGAAAEEEFPALESLEELNFM